jgi:hypothetical protein
LSLARASDDPVFKQRCEDLALQFAQSVGNERDLDITAPPFFMKSEPDSGDTSAGKK